MAKKIIPASIRNGQTITGQDTPVVTVYRHRGVEDQASKHQLRAILYQNRMEVWDAFTATHNCYFQAFGVPEEEHALLIITDGNIDFSVNSSYLDLSEHPMAEKLFQGLRPTGYQTYSYDFDWNAAVDRARMENAR